MKRSLRPYFTFHRPQLTSQLFIPLVIVLTLIGLVNSLQAFSVTHAKHTAFLLGKYFISKTLFCWYYIILAYLVQNLSTKLYLTRETILRWCSIHFVLLILSGLFHITVTMGIERILWGNSTKTTFYRLLLDSPSIWLDIAVYILFLLGFSMIEQQRINHENERRYSQLEVQLLKSQLQELRSTLYPQFFFHTLQSIADLLDHAKNKDANNILARLSSFLRTTVYDNERDEIPLEEELQPLRQYIEIEKVRFPGGLSLCETCDENIQDALVPNSILQPIVEKFVEGALKLHLAPYEIMLDIHKESDQLIIGISDISQQNQKGREEPLQDDVLFTITKGRLVHLYKNDQAFNITWNRSGGIIIQIVLPFHTQYVNEESPFALEKIS
jgi:two-component system, LytTR family, sensor kinase